MDEVAIGANVSDGAEVSIFTNVPKVTPCSWNECLSGHRWPPATVVGNCPGCGGPVVAVRQENCPYCNEPVARVNLRHDLVPQGGGVVPRCKTGKTLSESIDVTMERHAWETGQASFKMYDQKTMEEKSGKKSGG